MAQKVTVALEDDLDGGPADETVRFRLGSADYEIDLNATNASVFRQQLALCIAHACKPGRGQHRRPVRTASSRERSEGIRAWAKDQGIVVSAGGASPPASSSSTKPPPENPGACPGPRPVRSNPGPDGPLTPASQRCAVGTVRAGGRGWSSSSA
jgi:nucleoid-associated protein Lsr2